jgi:hypothetical protein
MWSEDKTGLRAREVVTAPGSFRKLTVHLHERHDDNLTG